MRTHTASFHPNHQVPTVSAEKFVPVMATSIQMVVALLAAIGSATAIIVLSIWATGLDLNNLLGASAWGAGLVFLGLAVDNRETGALLQLLTGLMLLVLAWLQAFVSPGFVIVSGLLLASWAAVGVFRKLR